MNPSICEFIAENEIIQIVPNFKQRQLHLIGGDFGPFEASSPIEVPIWLAIHLKRQQKCTIIAPNWLISEELKKLILTESEMDGFAPIPEYFFEITHILIASAPENLENVEQLKTLVKDLQDKREAKMRASVIKFMEQFQKEKAELNTGKAFVHSNAQMTNLTRFEICHFRAALVEPSRELDRLFGILNSESLPVEEKKF